MSDVLLDVTDGIATVTMNRPQCRNALNGSLCEALAQAFADIVSRDDIKVGIITGSGSSFCSGMDLKAFARGENISSRGLPMGVDQRIDIDKPMIAAVEGYAIAAGFELLGFCDIVVAGRSAKFGLSEVKRGLIPAGGGLLWLARQAPARLVNEWILTGDEIDADTLLRHGVINRICDDHQALNVARDMALRISANGPLALAACKRILRESPNWTVREMFERQQPSVEAIFASADAREGATAFAQKRLPAWQGR